MITESIHKRLKLEELDTTLSTLRITRPAELERMRQSLERSGQLNPVIVRLSDDKYQVLDGFKRYFIAQDLGWEFLEARILDIPLTEGKAIMLSYNRGGRSLLDYDEALVIYNLKSEHLLDQVAISRLTGYSRSWVCRRLALIEKLDPALQDALRMGLITNSQARALVKLPRGNQQEVMRCITIWHLTSRDSSVLVEKYLQSDSRKEQEYVLSHPREVIEQSYAKEEIFDIRLSQHGNRLLKSIEHLLTQQNIFIGLFHQHLTGKLSDLETAILDEKIKRLKKGAVTIQSIINDKTWKNAG
jgi:ParB family transcriptional regulator, chromosome partitioning protein